MFGARCPVCLTERQQPVGGCCRRCGEELTPKAEARCPRCAVRLGPHIEVDKRCTNCRTQWLGFRSATALFSYQGAVRRQIHAAKFAREWTVGRRLAATFARGIGRERLSGDIDLIVPVPMFWWERRSRGMNLADELSSALADKLRIEHARAALRQVRPASPQYSLSPVQRFRNIEGLFAVNAGIKLKGRTVLLVDDVLTTGATSSECADLLRKAGAKAVHVAVLARTEPAPPA